MSRTFRLRHLPSLGAKKFVDGRLNKYEDDVDEELYRDLAHQWYNFPCIIGQTFNYFRYGWERKINVNTHEQCLNAGMLGLSTYTVGPWKFFRLMRSRIPREVATVWSHPWVGMAAGGGKKKSYRVRNNRDYRREVRTTERRALMEDEEVPFPIYKKSVLWEMW